MASTLATRKSLSQRMLGGVFVIAFHVGIIYLLISGLGHSIIEVVTGPIQMSVIEESAPENTPPPPPPPPKIEVPPPEFVPPPDIEIAQDAPVESTTAISNVTTTQAPPPPPAPDVITKPRIDPRHPNETPPYPPASRRAKEQGVTTLELHVNEAGRVVEARVVNSSGFPRLDDAAVDFAVRKWRYMPATRNGVPFAMWINVGMRWKLK